MITSVFSTLILMVAPLLCVIFTDQDRTDFNAQFPNGFVSEACGSIVPERQMWDRTTHEPLDKYIVGAQVLTNTDCEPAKNFLQALPTETIDPALDLIPPEE